MYASAVCKKASGGGDLKYIYESFTYDFVPVKFQTNMLKTEATGRILWSPLVIIIVIIYINNKSSF
jgi:hypothetical protein